VVIRAGIAKANARCPVNSLGICFILWNFTYGSYGLLYTDPSQLGSVSHGSESESDLFPMDPSPSLTCFPQLRVDPQVESWTALGDVGLDGDTVMGTAHSRGPNSVPKHHRVVEVLFYSFSLFDYC